MGAKILSTFSGIGCQERGLQKAFKDIEVIGTSEIDREAIVSYACIHHGLTKEMIENYKDYPSEEEMRAELTEKNIGYVFEKNQPYNWNRVKGYNLKKYWLANKLNKNLGDISKVDVIKEEIDIFTYSFPCQSISAAGKQEGMGKGTRSGLVWEIVRILENTKEKGILPKFLLMENVSALVSKKFIDDFENLNEIISDIGYDCYWQILNACDYGVPQTRKRVFGLYVRKDLNLKYTFPKPKELNICLRDILDDVVEEKYILNKPFTITDETFTKNVIGTNKPPYRTIGQRDQTYNENKCMGALVSTDYKQPKQVYTRCFQIAKLDIKGKDCLKRVYSKDGLAPTITTIGGRNAEPKILTSTEEKMVVRKLTPTECFKLMGFEEADVQKCIDIGMSNIQLYNQAGNGIVCNCIEAIFKDGKLEKKGNEQICKEM